MKKRVIPIAGLSALFSAAALATPAMTVLTVNTGDPMAYAEWTKSSGEAIAKSVGAGVGGICLASSGYYISRASSTTGICLIAMPRRWVPTAITKP